jgi:hypothetical protein
MSIFGKTGSGAIDLSAIAAGNGGFVINGQSANDWSGWPVAGAGDVNGDGLADLIVGARRSDPLPAARPGAAMSSSARPAARRRPLGNRPRQRWFRHQWPLRN